jgi:hypothetical protein
VAGRSRPARQTHPRPLISGPTGGTNGDLSCTVRLCQGDEPGGRPSCRPWSGRPHSCGGCVGLLPSSPTSLGRTGGGADANLGLGTPDHLGIARPPGLRAGPFSRALGPGSRPGTHQNIIDHTRGERCVLVLERLPSSGRTCCGVFRLRRWPRAGLSSPSGVGEKGARNSERPVCSRCG